MAAELRRCQNHQGLQGPRAELGTGADKRVCSLALAYFYMKSDFEHEQRTTCLKTYPEMEGGSWVMSRSGDKQGFSHDWVQSVELQLSHCNCGKVALS